jgi:SprT-like family.
MDDDEDLALCYPTEHQYCCYRMAFDYFNERLFDNDLPGVMLSFSRKAKTKGFFAKDRWSYENDSLISTINEISINPDLLRRPMNEIMSTLVHEMTHLWQQEYGKPSRSTYHNREFADKMEAVGLFTSDTGQPGGKRVGQSISHYIVEGGAFDRAFAEMPETIMFPWMSGEAEKPTQAKAKNESKVKYTCPGCNQNAWGKPGLKLGCHACKEKPTMCSR